MCSMNYTAFNIRSSEAKEMNERKKSRDFWYRGTDPEVQNKLFFF
jgi:hypothetical protein